MLLLIIVTFVVVGAICARRIQNAMLDRAALALRGPSVGSNSHRLRRDIIVTVAVVFIAFLFRAVFTFMYALAELLQNDGACAQLCDPLCNNVCVIPNP